MASSCCWSIRHHHLIISSSSSPPWKWHPSAASPSRGGPRPLMKKGAHHLLLTNATTTTTRAVAPLVVAHISKEAPGLKMASFTFTKAFFLANTLMFIQPLGVLAETCEPDNQLFNMPLLFGIALIGATVGGLLARQRRGELKRLNDQLRQINAALRRQAKIESYAPNLSYAPVGRIPEEEVIIDPRKEQLISNLRTGKNHLRNQDPEKAFTEFKTALDLAQSLGDHIEEKKAARGLGASLQRQGKYKDAIKYHSLVLEVSKKANDDSGTTEAYGAIADCYTELGDLERAGKFYDVYIARLETN
ncbi:protein FLUORESCENT IN BLUE LIGHT, chloroplastic-like isoform X1 [Iris pallida]|uniref:Protein FLUORESCENT IN BLUE LIGHT, chloroplastic-like isoform X1 n=1 Tax=Iris pallida TaxID=29817 RepID=A0AAX6DGC8_IRIPA|nr:protein FLUORESCENT IN BLUE LIGHT, chloroplastic-like isoform X1 [Iris pallida]